MINCYGYGHGGAVGGGADGGAGGVVEQEAALRVGAHGYVGVGCELAGEGHELEVCLAGART